MQGIPAGAEHRPQRSAERRTCIVFLPRCAGARLRTSRRRTRLRCCRRRRTRCCCADGGALLAVLLRSLAGALSAAQLAGTARRSRLRCAAGVQRCCCGRRARSLRQPVRRLALSIWRNHVDALRPCPGSIACIPFSRLQVRGHAWAAMLHPLRPCAVQTNVESDAGRINNQWAWREKEVRCEITPKAGLRQALARVLTSQLLACSLSATCDHCEAVPLNMLSNERHNEASTTAARLLVMYR